jgi:hypothetical protein
MRSMDGNTFFAIFQTFAMDTTLLHLIFIKNVKKVKNQPTLMAMAMNKYHKMQNRTAGTGQQ